MIHTLCLLEVRSEVEDFLMEGKCMLRLFKLSARFSPSSYLRGGVARRPVMTGWLGGGLYWAK